ncbi:Phytochrome-like protein cph1 [Anaerohalosphaera lusitana]|uniref:histidine kinase n=1 Tax=Anaerohalosphaera lusitana TaxID=1936003 RepID=A0A1U9NGE4_9BACT|nr:HAMP domain-containing sensor histidine kinase [Anaerohalosphaera lusitana]AQT67001.1 Phytochrome-like protein cph1 [Anaerohalosphaera lusitana]
MHDKAAAQQVNRLISDEVGQEVSFITASVKKLDSLQRGLLALSRLGRVELDKDLIDMDELVKKIFTLQEEQVLAAKAEIDIDHLPNCCGDQQLISEVFSALLDNALKYLDPQRKGLIRISGHARDGMCRYSVRDNGIGISPEHQKKIFEVFHRLTPNGDTMGRGLGLTLARRIVLRHKGHIWVQSQEGQGSTFWVELPAADTQNKTAH